MQFEANFWHVSSVLGCGRGGGTMYQRLAGRGGGVVPWRKKVKQVRREEIVTAKPCNITIICSLLDTFAETAKTAH